MAIDLGPRYPILCLFCGHSTPNLRVWTVRFVKLLRPRGALPRTMRPTKPYGCHCKQWQNNGKIPLELGLMPWKNFQLFMMDNLPTIW